MIVDVGLSPQSLVDISSGSIGRAGPTLTNVLTRTLLSHGALVVSSRADRQAISDLLRNPGTLSESERQEWTNVLNWLTSAGRVRNAASLRETGLSSIESAADLEPTRGRNPLVAILADEVFDRLFPENSDGRSVFGPGIEAATAATAPVSDAFVAAQLQATREAYAVGETRESVWNELLEPLARFSKQVTIFDSYVFAGLHRRSVARDSKQEHLEWLLRHIDRAAPDGTHVKIYGSIGYEVDHRSGQMSRSLEEIARLLVSRWSSAPGRIQAVELIALTSKKLHPHDRHISFGSGIGLELPSGMDRLQHPVLSDTFSYSYKWQARQLKALRSRERTVELLRPVKATIQRRQSNRF